MAAFPTMEYHPQIFTSDEDNSCTICLSDYKKNEVLRLLPGCGHAFHVACIGRWLRQHSTCPVCRISLRIFSEWRGDSGPLISSSAKSRFIPGSLSDFMFEQLSECESTPGATPNALPKACSGHEISIEPMIVNDKGDMQMAASSVLRD